MTVIINKSDEMALTLKSTIQALSHETDKLMLTHLLKAERIFTSEVKPDCITIEGEYRELNLILCPVIVRLSASYHYAVVMEIGSEAHVDSLYLAEKFRRHAEYTAILRMPGAHLRITLAQYTAEASQKYDPDLFVALLCGRRAASLGR